MNRETFKRAKSEAKRFLESCTAYEKAHPQQFEGSWPYGIGGNKESGSVKRASLDLTRILAELRKPL